MTRKKQQEPAVTWKWVDGYPNKVSAEVAAHALDDIRRKNSGVLNSQAVVDDSRPDDAPLHPVFEWNDYEAAEAYRRHQASRLIRAVVRVDAPGAQPTRIYVGVTAPDKSATRRDTTQYVTTSEAAASPSLFADAMQRLVMHLNRAKASVDELQHAAQTDGLEPERLARITLALKAIEAASAAVADLH